MSTRSMIAIQYGDGKVDGIYCHDSGYVDNNGRIIQDNYQDLAKTKRLIDLGAISKLGPSPDQDPAVAKYGFLWDSDEYMSLPWDEQTKIWNSMTGTMAYHRDRGERLMIGHYDGTRGLKYRARYVGAEYIYLFKQDKETGEWSWRVMTYDEGEDEGLKPRRWYSLKQRIRVLDRMKQEQKA